MVGRLLLTCIVLLGLAAPLAGPAAAQDAPPSAIGPAGAAPDRSATGGAQTLEDVLRRQEALRVDDAERRGALGDPASAAPTTDQLGTLGGVSDSELWRALRYDAADVTTQARGPAAQVMMQDGGMAWVAFRYDRLIPWGAWLLLGTVALLALFYLLRGRIMIDGERAGTTIERFRPVERFAHWLLGGTFVVLAVTGLVLLFGRVAIIPLLGAEAFAPVAIAGKWVHNNLAWPFMLGLAMVIVFWFVHNLPSRHDIGWIAKGGGLFVKGVHPPAKKFNTGQKLIYWSVLVLGLSISASGVSLLFPFELPLFAMTFDKLNAIGLPQLLGLGELPAALSAQEEMQLAQAWHAIVGLVFIAIALAHIYIGSIGMEGAYDAMGSGQVDEQWAREHHSLWYEEVTGKPVDHGHDQAPGAARTPAE
jgi:formate dehydrogenase subunit gamma